jgi:hypothetical protein
MELEGIWWLPERPEHKVEGTLNIYDNHSSLLELKDFLIESELEDLSVEDDKLETISAIHGVIFEGGEEVTLLECLRVGVRYNKLIEFGATRKEQEIKPLITIVGKHIDSLSELKIKKIMSRIPKLDFWFTRNSCSDLIKFDERTIKITTGEKQIFCKKFNEFTFKVICFVDYSINQKGMSYTLKHVKIEPYVVLEFKYAKNLKDCYDLLSKLISLFTIAVLDKVHISEIICTSADNPLEGFKVYVPVEYCKISAEPKFIHSDRILFDFGQFKNRICIRNWLSMYERLKLLCEYYLSTITNENIPIDYKFLNLVIALEFYHRYSWRFEQHKIEPDKWSKIKEQITAFLLDELKSKSEITDKEVEHINQKIEFVYEKSLRRRLLEIIRYLEAGGVMFCNSEERDEFIHSVTQIRNRLVHGLSGDEAFDYNYEILLALTNKLKVIVESVILHELGFNKEEIKIFAEKRSKELAEWKLISPW